MTMTKLITTTLCIIGFSAQAIAGELVIATTFSSETTEQLVKQWEQAFPQEKLRLINRTAKSLESLLNQPNIENVDLILSSSPFLFYQLQSNQRLLELPKNYRNTSKLMPKILNHTTTAIAFSGYGILFNKTLLKQHNLPEPTDWVSLTHPNYYNGLSISSPSRSASNHIMLEMLLQQRGWEKGWQEFLTLAGNISLISSRSFSVSDKIKMEFTIAGITIDSYATAQLTDPNVGFNYFPNSIASPTFIAVHKNSKSPQSAFQFIDFLLNEKGQQIITTPSIAKYPLIPLDQQNPSYEQQQKLLSQPSLDYDLLLLRQKLVEKLFDTAITFRLNQLKESWALVHQQEAKMQQKSTALRAELIAIPITEQQAHDKEFLATFTKNQNIALEQEKIWSDFFQTKINNVINTIGNESNDQ